MNIRTFMSDKQALIEEGKRIVTSSDDAKYLRKVTIVNLLLNGASTSALSEPCGESSRTLSAWVKQVDEGGFEALRPKKQPGRPNKLTKDQKEEIKVAILSEPSLYGYNVWDGPSLSDFILKKYDVKLGVRQCQRLFHQLGFSQIRPQAFPSKDHEEDPSRGEFKKLKELFSRKKTRVVFQDEVHFTVEATITRQWFPKGSCPKVKSYPGRKSVAYSGFITYGSGELFVTKPSWFNYETTIASIREFIAMANLKRGEKIILVMDNAPWHKKAKRLIENEREYADIRKKVTIVSLPPYSPDLNPIEQVWRVTRREKTHNRYWKNLDVLTTTLDDWFSSFTRPNEKLASLCSFAW